VKIVLDSNVLIAAVAAGAGLCSQVAQECLARHQLVVCEEIIEEVARNLRWKIKLPAEIADRVARTLRQRAVVMRPARLPDNAAAHAEDLPILGVAVASRADLLVTGDLALRQIGVIEGVRIVSPRECWRALREKAWPEETD